MFEWKAHSDVNVTDSKKFQMRLLYLVQTIYCTKCLKRNDILGNLLSVSPCETFKHSQRLKTLK